MKEGAITLCTVLSPRRVLLLLLLATAGGCSSDIAGPPRGALSFTDVTAGYSHSCGLEVDGDVHCWGSSREGQVGSVDLDACADPVLDGPDCALTPRRVQTDIAMRAVSAGGAHTCALAVDGAPYCWGDNEQSQLGAGIPIGPCGLSDSCSRTPVSVQALTYASISAGGSHTCALREDGTAQCWGYGFSGRLGTGTTGDLSVPTDVIGGHRFSVIAAGGSSTCAITLQGIAYCWGHNHLGQLGDGTIEPRGEPAPVLTDVRFTSISVGAAHACAITAEGAAYCWGANFDGELGTGEAAGLCGNYECDAAPRPVVGGHTFTSITASRSATCGDTPDGVLCWGSNESGATGTGRSGIVAVPTRTRGPALRSVNLGFDHACGLNAAGNAYCWGSNWYGAVGAGDPYGKTSSPVPVAAP